MAKFRRTSVRLWQTELFVIVIVVAILVLSVSLSQGLQTTLTRLGETDHLIDTSALASQLGPEFPLSAESRVRLHSAIVGFRQLYGDDVWVYAPDGTVIDSASTGGPPADALLAARVQGLKDDPAYSSMVLKPGGYVLAGTAVYDTVHRPVAVVVASGSVSR